MASSITSSNITEIYDCVDINEYFKHVSKNNNNLTCIHINIRSIIKNFVYIELIVAKAKRSIDVLILSEVGITENLSTLFYLEGYSMYTQLRNGRKGGGIIMYILKKHKF